MSKIICDVCGTRYPDSSEQCPICGCVRSGAANEPEQNVLTEEMEIPSRPAVRGGRFSKANVRKRNKNLPVYEEPEVRSRAAAAQEEAEDSEEEFEEESDKKGSTVLNVLLVIVILALLAVSAYIFLNYFMPNLTDKEEPTMAPTEATVIQTEAPTEEPVPTEAPTVPCEQLVLDITDVTLHEVGEMYLLNVQVLPENTTDGLMYISSNEAVATVNEEGRVTAVGEGSVVISVFCGEQQLQCNVICDFQPATEAPTEAPAEAATEAPTEAPTEALKDVKLGVKNKDMTFKAGGQQATIKLTCKLSNGEVTWTSENEKIATVNADGVITRVGAGTTKIIGQYGDQKVEIIVRCPKK